MISVRMVFVLIVAVGAPALLFAGPQEGVMMEFRRAEEAIRNQRTSPEQRKKTLEENLVRAVQQAILRHYYPQRDEYLRGLSAETVLYEKPAGYDAHFYYVKYRNFLLRLEYATNPEEFIQSPTLEKFLQISEGDSHSPPPTPAGG